MSWPRPKKKKNSSNTVNVAPAKAQPQQPINQKPIEQPSSVSDAMKVQEPAQTNIQPSASKLPPALAFGGDDLPEVKKTEAPSLTSLPNRKRSGRKRLSISGAFTEEETEEETTENKTEQRQDLPKSEFTQNELENQWREYLEDLKKTGKQRVYSSFVNKHPKLKPDFKVQLMLDNEIQQSYFEEEKPTMLQFLQKRLNNYSLSFNIIIAENARQLEPYTADEKYQYMLDKNPHLALLRQKLNLDIE